MGMAFAWLGKHLARYLSAQIRDEGLAPPLKSTTLLAHLQPADVLLVEGHSRISSVIKYMTQSTWSHASLYVGPRWREDAQRSEHCFVEADLLDGVRSVGIEEYASFHTRICRPVGMTEQERDAVCRYAISRIGNRYDLRNVLDLARYLLPLPPVSPRFRRELFMLGSGDPTRAICSTLIAQAFQSVNYPIMPLQMHIEEAIVPSEEKPLPASEATLPKVKLIARHHSFFSPRDFDVSPYFQIVKPTVESGFDFRVLRWLDDFSDKD